MFPEFARKLCEGKHVQVKRAAKFRLVFIHFFFARFLVCEVEWIIWRIISMSEI